MIKQANCVAAPRKETPGVFQGREKYRVLFSFDGINVPLEWYFLNWLVGWLTEWLVGYAWTPSVFCTKQSAVQCSSNNEKYTHKKCVWGGFYFIKVNVWTVAPLFVWRLLPLSLIDEQRILLYSHFRFPCLCPKNGITLIQFPCSTLIEHQHSSQGHVMRIYQS